MDEYYSKPVTEENYKDICWLFRERGINYSPDFVRRKFNTAFTGITNIGFIAYHSQTHEPAAHYSVFPCYLWFNNKKILAAQSGDTITHERHQRKGLFVTLAELTYDLAAKSGVQLVFGFPNQNSYHGFMTRLKWIHSETMLRYEIPVKAVPWFRVAAKARVLPVYHSLLKMMVAEEKIVANSLLDESLNCSIHDEDFFQYKTYTRNYVAEVEDVLIWFKPENGLTVGDVRQKSGFNGDEILSSLFRLARKIGCEKILLRVSPGTRLHQYLAHKYSGTEDLAVGWRILNDDFPKGIIKFTNADCDIY